MCVINRLLKVAAISQHIKGFTREKNCIRVLCTINRSNKKFIKHSTCGFKQTTNEISVLQLNFYNMFTIDNEVWYYWNVVEIGRLSIIIYIIITFD